MKINKISAIIALLLSVVLTYAVYAFCSENEQYVFILLVVSFISLCSTLLGTMGISMDDVKHNVNIRILSAAFFAIFLVEHAIIAIIGVSLSTLIVLSGIFYLIYLLLFYTVSKMDM